MASPARPDSGERCETPWDVHLSSSWLWGTQQPQPRPGFAFLGTSVQVGGCSCNYLGHETKNHKGWFGKVNFFAVEKGFFGFPVGWFCFSTGAFLSALSLTGLCLAAFLGALRTQALLQLGQDLLLHQRRQQGLRAGRRGQGCESWCSGCAAGALRGSRGGTAGTCLSTELTLQILLRSPRWRKRATRAWLVL